jgi:hypothetical protein
MMIRQFYIVRLIWLILTLATVHAASAQFVKFAPVPNKLLKESKGSPFFSRINARNTFPFWDDFSSGLDTLKWDFSGTTYTETIGINPPSIGMLLFDGVDENGTPYSVQQTEQGNADKITSKPFDLSVSGATTSNSLYLSFFWQLGGRGELPDENDVLILEFLNADNTWSTVWSQTGGVLLDRTTFQQEVIQIDLRFQHAEFKFRFFTKGRLSGPFDSWLIDYIFLNTNQNTTNQTFRDRSLTRRNRVRLGDFGAYPRELLADENQNWSTVSNEFLNLENRFRAMEYSIAIRDTTSQLVFPINENTPFDPVPNSKERRSFESRTLANIPIPENNSELEISTSLTSGDGLFFEINGSDTTRHLNVDFRDNDQVKTYFPLRDFFAYDNGSADYAAGINQRSGFLAVQYNTPSEVYLKGISINFTNPRQANQAVDILVWKDLNEKPIFRKEALIPIKQANEQFLYFSLDTNIKVNGPFYIGFAQFTDDFIFVGLDKTNDFGEKIFYNVVGAWVQNKEVKGSLMIRPHISLGTPFVEAEIPDEKLRIYPNPVESYLNIEGIFSQIRIFDSFGREIFLERILSTKGEIVTFKGQRSGIYVLNVSNPKGTESFRILVR